jgi:dynein heavy chain
VVGLEKLEFATQQVNTMSAELEALQPSLKIAQVETAELMKVIEARLPGVEEIRAVVSVDVAAANKTAAEVGAVKADW